jgi:hypothetical protein
MSSPLPEVADYPRRAVCRGYWITSRVICKRVAHEQRKEQPFCHTYKEPDSYMQQSSEVHLTISIKLLVQLELV